MEQPISVRIELIINHFGYTKNSFSKAIGLTNNVTIGRIINENRHPSYSVLERIILTFGSINTDWLLTGRGEMLRDNTSVQNANSKVKGDNNIVGSYSNTVISHKNCKELELENNYLKKELEMLKKQILMQEKMITMLENNNK